MWGKMEGLFAIDDDGGVKQPTIAMGSNMAMATLRFKLPAL